ncbi:MAG: hypothetical protein DRI54_05615, partial [Bacteroidetes bacterium]
TVDNRSGGGANYTSVSGAINAASNGDTIYIHPSSINYGDITVNKSLVFIGPGHHPEYTGGMGVSLNQISLSNGSSGSKFTGLILTQIRCNLFAQSHDIVISNNFFNTLQAISGGYGSNAGAFGDSDNWLIEGNVIIEGTGCGGCKVINLRTSASTNSNWIISNNFIQTKSVENNSNLFADLNSSTIVENNIIVHQNTHSIFESSVSGGEFRNNIFWVTRNEITDIMVDAIGVIFSNNLTYHSNGSLIPLTGNNNVDNSNPDFIAIASDNPVWEYVNNYQLNSNSPGENVGTDGTDVGIYGGGFPFRTEGYPQDFPRLQAFDLLSNTIVPPGGSIEINLKATKAGL